MTIEEILSRDHTVVAPRPFACLKHRGVDLLERPLDCMLCAHDVRDALRTALETNRWLDQWRTDLIHALTSSRST